MKEKIKCPILVFDAVEYIALECHEQEIEKLQFELQAADKENERLTKENKQLVDVLKDVLITFEDNEQAIPVNLEMKIDKVIHLTK